MSIVLLTSIYDINSPICNVVHILKLPKSKNARYAYFDKNLKKCCAARLQLHIQLDA